ncbi:MAG: hypothetical protein AAB569_06595 [Patescibacteria group bacterium]
MRLGRLEALIREDIKNTAIVGAVVLGIYGISQLLFANIYSPGAIKKAKSSAEKNAMEYHNATHGTEKTGRKALKAARDLNLKHILADGLASDVEELGRQHEVGLGQLVNEAVVRGNSNKPS